MSDIYYITDVNEPARAGIRNLISAHDYISGAFDHLMPGARLVNACLDRSYLSIGYYVGLLAEARGHSISLPLEPRNVTHLPICPSTTPRLRALHRQPTVGVLHSPGEPFSPSSSQAINQFSACASRYGLDVVLLSKDQIGDLESLDGLFIRDFTSPTNASFYFATRAVGLGIPVIDDPASILRCANKVFINEFCLRHAIATPKTLIVMPTMDFDFIARQLGVPFVLKLPDSAFSLGVHKVDSRSAGERLMKHLRKKSAVLCAQEFMPTEFDWRVATLNGKAIFVCKYFMAEDHWQINRHHEDGYVEGHGCAVPLRECPPALLQFAERASVLAGNGLYGIDIKEFGGSYRLIEINDNPNIEDLETSVSEDEVWGRLADFFVKNIRLDSAALAV